MKYITNLIFCSAISTLTFNDLALGELARGRYDNWFIEWPSSNISSVGESGDLKYLEVKGYFQTVFAYPVAEKYTVDMKMLATNLSSNAGLFIRSSHDRFLQTARVHLMPNTLKLMVQAQLAELVFSETIA